MPSSRLPAIPFGAATARGFDDVAACGEFLARLPDAPSRFGPVGPAADFRIRLRNVPLPGVSLVAGAGTAKATTHCSPRVAVVIPFARCETVLRTTAGEHRWAAPYHAFFIPAGERIAAESTSGAFLRLDVVEADLVRTAAGMAANGNGRGDVLDLKTARPIPLHVQGTNWLPAIRALCDSVDAFDCDATRLAAAGIDDVVLRTAAMMLRPDLVLERRWDSRTERGFALDSLLEVITAHLAGRVTLADMERWSGRSARTIQLAFRKRFGIGPIEWLRDRRLDLVRARLLAARTGETVQEIAAACGIHRPATLVPEYLARFGEKPSDTLRRAGR
jgi:AraC-like DNA-binding protein